MIKSPDWLILLAIRRDERRKSWERAHLANAGEFIVGGGGGGKTSEFRPL